MARKLKEYKNRDNFSQQLEIPFDSCGNIPVISEKIILETKKTNDDITRVFGRDWGNFDISDQAFLSKEEGVDPLENIIDILEEGASSIEDVMTICSFYPALRGGFDYIMDFYIKKNAEHDHASAFDVVFESFEKKFSEKIASGEKIPVRDIFITLSEFGKKNELEDISNFIKDLEGIGRDIEIVLPKLNSETLSVVLPSVISKESQEKIRGCLKGKKFIKNLKFVLKSSLSTKLPVSN